MLKCGASFVSVFSTLVLNSEEVLLLFEVVFKPFPESVLKSKPRLNKMVDATAITPMIILCFGLMFTGAKLMKINTQNAKKR